METETVKVRINFSSREIEVSGSEKSVQHWMERFDEFLQEFAQPEPANGSASSGHGAVPAIAESAHSPEASEAFGEYFHRFPTSLSDVDKVLVAAAFAQTHDPENVFTTGQASDLLKEQGIKVANPSECVRRNMLAKRVFVVAKRKFRVSQIGAEYLKGLTT